MLLTVIIHGVMEGTQLDTMTQVNKILNQLIYWNHAKQVETFQCALYKQIDSSKHLNVS